MRSALIGLLITMLLAMITGYFVGLHQEKSTATCCKTVAVKCP